MEDKKDFKFGQIHLIPFDIGFMFYDVLTPSNEENKIFGEKFIKKIHKVYKPLTIKTDADNENCIGKSLIDKDRDSHEIMCAVKIRTNLYCYICNTGIGIFVLGDFDQRAIQKRAKGSEGLKLPILMNVQKKLTNEALMSTKGVEVKDNNAKSHKNKQTNKKYKKVEDPEFRDVLLEERRAMHVFQNYCWKIAKEIAEELNFSSVRPYTSNAGFKNYGLSYSMNIMISNDLPDEGVQYLLNGGAPKLNWKKKFWVKAANHYNQIKHSCQSKGNKVFAGKFEMNFSWSSIIIESKKKIDSLKKFVERQELSTLLFAEMAIQARWFNADNCIGNSIENQYSKIENLQTLQSFIEYCSAELENPTSSSMSSLYLKIRQQIIETSKIQQLYKSISDRMKSQKEIKLGLNRKRTNKLILVTDILLGCFTGAGVFKTFYDIATKNFKWWDLFLLVLTILIFIGIQIWIYFAHMKSEK